MDLIQLIGETTEYDKKKSLEVNKPKSWLKSVNAFANSFGEKLIFGISDDDQVIGLVDSKKDAEVISECIKSRMNPIPRFQLFIRVVNNKKLIELVIMTGDQTPYYYSGEG